MFVCPQQTSQDLRRSNICLFYVYRCLNCKQLWEMDANGAECEQPQKRLGPKDKQNGSSTGLLS